MAGVAGRTAASARVRAREDIQTHRPTDKENDSVLCVGCQIKRLIISPSNRAIQRARCEWVIPVTRIEDKQRVGVLHPEHYGFLFLSHFYEPTTHT